MKKSNKLIRDRIPEILEEKGANFSVRVLNDDEYKRELLLKVVEEAEEIAGTGGNTGELVKEIGDVMEVMDHVVATFGLDLAQIGKVKRERRRLRGGFSKKLFLENKPMNDKEFLLETFLDELPRFERVFQAFNNGALDYKPDALSKSAHELIKYMVGETYSIPVFLRFGNVDFTTISGSTPKTIEEASQLFRKSIESALEIVRGMSDEDWQKDAVMMQGSIEIWKSTRGKMAWGMLLDLIHHRGQLSTYIRPMGGKVPSIYGPSADTQD